MLRSTSKVMASRALIEAQVARRGALAPNSSTPASHPPPIRAQATRCSRASAHRCHIDRLSGTQWWLSSTNPRSNTPKDGPLDSVAQPDSTTDQTFFVPRRRFDMPEFLPSWYAGHMHRAIRSMPYLLSRSPPPLVIEARDARLPITSINPTFESLLRNAPSANFKDDNATGIGLGWNSRRLVVYTKRDLIDPRLERPIRAAFHKYGEGQEVMFVDTRSDKDVKKVLEWVQRRARQLAASPLGVQQARSERAEKRAKATLSGAFRHTPTPEEGVRLLILGMPNVGKSSLLNALRRVGTGKGKAASTAPEPGHTRKLTGTVRITKHGLTRPEDRHGGRRDGRARRGEGMSAGSDDSGGDSSTLAPLTSFAQAPEVEAEGASEGEGDAEKVPRNKESYDPPIYVYDTPGVMLPYLGRGDSGGERAIKLAVTAGIKTSLFDKQMLVDYLLFRMNLRYAFDMQQYRELHTAGGGDAKKMPAQPPQPAYISDMPMPPSKAAPTNSVTELLELVAERAPGTLNKGGTRDLDAAAEFFLQRWRDGKVGERKGELDTGIGEMGRRLRTEVFTEHDAENLLLGGRDSLPAAAKPEQAAAIIDRMIASYFHDVERGLLKRQDESSTDQDAPGEEIDPNPNFVERPAKRISMLYAVSRADGEAPGSRKKKSEGSGGGGGGGDLSMSMIVRARSRALESGTSINQAKLEIKRAELARWKVPSWHDKRSQRGQQKLQMMKRNAQGKWVQTGKRARGKE